jgi:hypothetical protein
VNTPPRIAYTAQMRSTLSRSRTIEIVNSTAAAPAAAAMTMPYTSPRATVSAGTAVLSRMEPTTDSIVSVTCAVQSGAGVVTVADALLSGDAGPGRGSTGLAMAGTLPSVRSVVAVAAGGLVAAIGALMLGEQPLEGLTVLLAGVLFGMAVAEVVVSVARHGDVYLAIAAALLTEAGMVWALYIETGHNLGDAPIEAWIAVVLGGVSAGLWLRTAARRARHTPSAP